MTLFNNMLELNNSFLLIALIIIAVICIYLLYSNLTKSGETASLKAGINALIQQNKKRDEIINFLLERVENLESNVTPAQSLPVLQNPVMHPNPNVADDIDDVLTSAEQHIPNTVSAAEVENILDSITNTENEHLIVNGSLLQHDSTTHPSGVSNTVEKLHDLQDTVCTGLQAQCNATTETPIHRQSLDSLELSVGGIHTEEQHERHTTASSTEYISEFPELESEFEGLLTTTDAVDQDVNALVTNQSEPEVVVSNDLVSALLDADEESLAGDHEFDLSTVPKVKEKLNAQYTVKQLKALSRQLKLKSKGNKTELINRIHEKLN